MFLNDLAIKCIQKYQQNKEIIGSGRCKHYPTCSNYAIGCYQKFNFIKASFLSLFRIIRCNPLTKKCYDPVPLNKAEKKERDKKLELLKNYRSFLSDIYQSYPLMEIDDFIRFIYEGTFGPLFWKNITTEDFDNFIPVINLPNKEELLSDKYVRIYNCMLSSQEKQEYLSFINSLDITDDLIQEFNYKLYIFKQMVKKKEINLDYDLTSEIVEQYMINGPSYPKSSNIYIKNYQTNYIIKKRINNEI